MRGVVAAGLIADLNLCTLKGTYEVVGSNADLSNLPTVEGTIYGLLEVNTSNTGGTFAWQKLRTIIGMEYNRYCVNGSWSTWV